MTRVYSRREALKRGAKPTALEEEVEEHHRNIEHLFERKESERFVQPFTRSERFLLKQLKKKNRKNRKGYDTHAGVVSAFGLKKARVRF